MKDKKQVTTPKKNGFNKDKKTMRIVCPLQEKTLSVYTYDSVNDNKRERAIGLLRPYSAQEH